MLINIRGEDIEFDEKDLFLKDNIDYYDDFLVEDKIQDLESAKDNINMPNKVRPIKPSAKTSFKPREKKSVMNNFNTPGVNNQSNNIVVSSNNQQVNNSNNNKYQLNFNPKTKENVNSNFENNKVSNNPNKEGLSGKFLIIFI
jgi:hypothetical protein